MSPRTAFAAISIAAALFLVASLLLFHSDTPHQLIGAIFMLAGATIAACAKFLSPQALSARWLAVLDPLFRVRPITIVLWGGGLFVFGLLMVGRLI